MNTTIVYDTECDNAIVAALAQRFPTAITCTLAQYQIHIATGIGQSDAETENKIIAPVFFIRCHTDADHQLWLSDGVDFKQAMSINFNKGALGFRLSRNNTTKQPLAKAIGIKPGIRPYVLDATAGLGKDGFVLASLGCRVDMQERSPLIHALLSDGLRRAKLDLTTSEICQQISLQNKDTIKYLSTNTNLPHDVVYIDPMYPHRSKSALVKKEMRIVRNLIGDDHDAENLMAAALASNIKRVVVKRPAHATGLIDRKTSFHISGKTTRYDVYVK